jgi:hypothetical protein
MHALHVAEWQNMGRLSVCEQYAATCLGCTARLDGNQGMGIFAYGFPGSVKASSFSTNLPTSDIEVVMNSGSSSLSYDAGTDQYTFVWKTDKSWAAHLLLFYLIS